MSRNFADYSDDQARGFLEFLHPDKHDGYYSARVYDAHRETTTQIYDQYWRHSVGMPTSMRTYSTDHSGHTECCLFEEPFCRMRGIYVLLTPVDFRDRQAPGSPYGSERIDLPIGEVLNPEDFTLYVVDFYEFYGGRRPVGYVTIVSVRKGSAEEDVFIQRHFNPLDITQPNPWINLRYGDQYRVNSTWYLYIQLYCMFDVNMANAVHTSGVPTSGSAGAMGFVIGRR